MGHGAKANRRTLIEHVEACIAQANLLSTEFTSVREANNGLATKTDADVKKLHERLDVISAWLKRVEQHDTLTRELVHEARNKAQSVRVESHLRLTSLTFWQRVRWFMTGALPDLPPENPVGVKTALTLKELAEKATVRRVETQSFPQQDYGRASAGMAPRSLP
jgi:hypothetical protein